MRPPDSVLELVQYIGFMVLATIIGTAVGATILYAVCETVEHFID